VEGGQITPQIFCLPKTFLSGYCIEEAKIKETGVRVAENGVPMLEAGPNQSSSSFEIDSLT
jgi:hypothetical protein